MKTGMGMNRIDLSLFGIEIHYSRNYKKEGIYLYEDVFLKDKVVRHSSFIAKKEINPYYYNIEQSMLFRPNDVIDIGGWSLI